MTRHIGGHHKGPRLANGAGLTAREVEILQYMAKNLTYPEIAEATGIRYATIKFHAYNIVDKLGGENRHKAVEIAREMGLVEG